MGRGKSKSTKEKQLEYDIKKIKDILLKNKKEKDFRKYEGKTETYNEVMDIKDEDKGEICTELMNDKQKNEKISQEKIIRSILEKKDTFVVLPTGGGKSYCFQGPSFCFEGLTLVITPLVSLIHDQVRNFNKEKYEEICERNVKGDTRNESYDKKIYRAIYPGMNNLSLEQFFDEIINPLNVYEGDKVTKVQYKLIYVSPERLSNPKFMREFKKREERGEIKIDLVVVDEAHCMSQWGFDFRESYLTIGKFINNLKKRPVVAAFSATVTKQDRQQISNLLKFNKNSKYFISYEKRKNLSVEIIRCEDNRIENKTESGQDVKDLNTRFYELVRILKHKDNRNKRCIIYCNSVKTVDYLHKKLMQGKINANHFCPAKFHGKMTGVRKNRSIERFTFKNQNKSNSPLTNIMIATKAFGMGINRDDIEIVIHFDIPTSIEEYYQEIGRAGRKEGINGKCYLLYTEENRKTTFRWSLKESLSEEIKKQPIASNFTEKILKNIRFYRYYRLARVWDYCNKLLDDKEFCYHDYIMEYFSEDKIGEDSIKLMNEFYVFLDEKVLPYVKNNKIIKKNCCFKFKEEKKEGIEFSENDNYQMQINEIVGEVKDINKDINKILGQVNELHINNTRIANYIRWKGYDISVDEPNNPKTKELFIKEWKRKEKNIAKDRIGLMRTDITEDAVFIRMLYPQAPISEHIAPIWGKYRNKDIKVMFVVNQLNNRIERILRMRDEWMDITDDDSLYKLMEKEVLGLFSRERYNDWYKGKEIFVKIKGKRQREVSFSFKVDSDKNVDNNNSKANKLNYFDLCVADAIYSIENNGKNIIYIKTIWEVLTGYNYKKNVFPSNASKIKSEIVESIKKMQKLRITINDDVLQETIKDEIFLPITLREGEVERGYSYEKIPPLYRYAELLNGEIIKIPVSLLNVHNIPILKDRSQKNETSYLLRNIDNMVLNHYLLHRIAISMRKNRGNYINFDTIQNILRPNLPKNIKNSKKILKRKVLSIMSYYKRIGYVQSGGYIKDFNYILCCNGKEINMEKMGIFINETYKNEYYKSINLWKEEFFKKYKGGKYSLSTECLDRINENENSYINYDGIIIIRNERVIEILNRKMEDLIEEKIEIELQNPLWSD